MAPSAQANSEQIYLDYNASTPIDPQFAAVMQRAIEGAFGNPSSTHWAGEPAQFRAGWHRGEPVSQQTLELRSEGSSGAAAGPFRQGHANHPPFIIVFT